MRSKITSNEAIRQRGGWRERLGNLHAGQLTPLGLFLMLLALLTPNRAVAQAYAYEEPAVEIYDLTTASGTITNLKEAGYKINHGDAWIITNPTGYELNDRIAVHTANDLSWNGGLYNSKNAYRYIGISNLKEYDRVIIEFEGTVTFASHHNTTYVFDEFNSSVFLDQNDNGIQEATESTITVGTPVTSNAVYTMLGDGHLDIALHQNAKIKIIKIVSDHKASFIDIDNGDGSHTMKFDIPGQLVEKTVYIASGITISVGNDKSNAEHATITPSDEGLASTVKGQNGKRAMVATNNIPTSGTFYKFVPEQNGTLTFKFKAMTVDVNDQIISGDAKYVVVKNATNTTPLWSPGAKSNGATMNNNNQPISVEAGNIYYLYGLTEDGNTGIPRLVEVTFTPDFKLAELAKLGTNNMSSDDNLTDVTLASGMSVQCTIKRHSSSIKDGAIATVENGKLKISNIQYKDDADKGGVILIELNATKNSVTAGKSVFALTIPYSAGYLTDTDGNSEGHRWDFSSDELEIGRYFNNWFADKQSNGQAAANQATNPTSQLYKEINKTDGTNPDWTFTYRVKRSNGIVNDPMFLNVYDMEGDNADMIWETEGLWFNTAPGKSAIFNEKIGSIDRSNTTQDDPDRYVAILPGTDDSPSEFIIPGLQKDDRVIIFMAGGDGSGANTCFFNITNARDALYKEITSEYRAGGSIWNVHDTHNDPNYRGCYHFFAKEDGPMTFRLVGGSMCKIYSIEIYRGEHRSTNSVNNTSDKYILVNTAGAATADEALYTLHFRGKGEILANSSKTLDPEQYNNYGPTAIVHTGTVSVDGNHLQYVPGVGQADRAKYVSVPGEFGTFRLRLKCFDFTGEYVTDFADRNINVGYRETMTYPYTWDFTDIKTTHAYDGVNKTGDYNSYRDKVSSEFADATPYKETTSDWEVKGWDLAIWNSDGTLNTNNEVSDIDNMGDNWLFAKGSQLWAADAIIPETRGLWFDFDSNDFFYSKTLAITDKGISFANPSEENGSTGTRENPLRRSWWNHSIIVPSVPAKGAVYLRLNRDDVMKSSVKDEVITFNPWGSSIGAVRPNQTDNFFVKSYQFEGGSGFVAIDGTDANSAIYEIKNIEGLASSEDENKDDYIIAIYNPDETNAKNLTIRLNGFIVKKLAVTTDAKQVNKYGWATESRDHVVDPALTAYMTGYDFETCLVTRDPDYTNNIVYLSRVSLEDNGKVMRSLSNGQNGANIIHNKKNQPVSILNGGFHLFAPDMYDYKKGTVKVEGNDYREDSFKNNKSVTNGNTDGSNQLIAQVTAGTVPQTNASNNSLTNYVLTYQVSENADDNSQNIGVDDNDFGMIGFFKVRNIGVTSAGNQGYLPLNTTATAKYSIAFDDVEDIADDIHLQEILGESNSSVDIYYNLNGQKLDGKPSTNGIYIKNGKKVIIK